MTLASASLFFTTSSASMRTGHFEVNRRRSVASSRSLPCLVRGLMVVASIAFWNLRAPLGAFSVFFFAAMVASPSRGLSARFPPIGNAHPSPRHLLDLHRFGHGRLVGPHLKATVRCLRNPERFRNVALGEPVSTPCP